MNELLEKTINIRHTSLFLEMMDHTGHEFKLFWQGDDYPDIFELQCECGFRILIENDMQAQKNESL